MHGHADILNLTASLLGENDPAHRLGLDALPLFGASLPLGGGALSTCGAVQCVGLFDGGDSPLVLGLPPALFASFGGRKVS
jgi:hypothetical protein